MKNVLHVLGRDLLRLLKAPAALVVVVVLVVGWLAAPHVLDWATHTWYTVVRNRDLSASSETTASSAAASSEVTAEPAASSEVRADSEPESESALPINSGNPLMFFFLRQQLE